MARRLERWAPVGGIIFVVLMVVGTMFVADEPDPDAPQQQLATYLADSGNHTRNLIGADIWVVGALAFLWFVTRLRATSAAPKVARAPCRTWSLCRGHLRGGVDGFCRGLRGGGLCRRGAGWSCERP